MNTEQSTGGGSPGRYLSPLSVWALAFGCSVGWGSFIMPGSTFLPVAGPLGSVVGIGIGAAITLVVGFSYHYLMNVYPDSGGAFTYTKKAFGYDHGFLCSWFLLLTYVAIIWANATALPLIARSLFGSAFQFGFHYELAGFHIYLGEILLAVASILICGFVCMHKSFSAAVQTSMALVMCVGITVCFVAAFTRNPDAAKAFEPPYAPGSAPGVEIFNIVALAPWAFVGFESISHSTSEFKFSTNKIWIILTTAVIAAGAAYAMLALLAVSALPEGMGSWLDYVQGLSSLSGEESIPTLFAAHTALGGLGRLLFGLASLGGIITGLVGHFIASSRLIKAMGEDDMLPAWLGRSDESGVPRNALLILIGISAVIPFFGRTAISWIVDVTTVGAAIAYAYTSADAVKISKERGDLKYNVLGWVGLAISLSFVLFFLVPNILAVKTLSTESYLILAAWSILGFVVFRQIFKSDTKRRLGNSTVVWIVLLGLIILTSSVWARQASTAAAERAVTPIHEHYLDMLEEEGVDAVSSPTKSSNSYLKDILENMNDDLTRNMMVQMGLIIITLLLIFNMYSILRKREQQTQIEKMLAEESSRAKTSFLSNMSHEIRTPMNAIIGLDNIALKDPDISPRTRDQLEKIGASARHLLGLINDILDMSRIESGRMVLKKEEFDFRSFLDQINVIAGGQCSDKGLEYDCRIIGRIDDRFIGDDLKLRQVLINILGNSVKFTDPPGSVTFTAEQLSRIDGISTLRFTMKDTGIGMDKEFIPKLFEAFSQEDATTTNRYGGSGLGMAITKSIVEMMGGKIEVDSVKGLGSTFTVTVELGASDHIHVENELPSLPEDLRVLVIDDDEIACEHAKLILSDLGVNAELCVRGTDAYSMIKNRWDEGRPYQLILTDFRMPVIDGIELTREIRRFDNGSTAVIILTGYDFDERSEEARKAGVDGVLSKPLFAESLLHEIQFVMRSRLDMSSEGRAAKDAAAAAGAASADGAAGGTSVRAEGAGQADGASASGSASLAGLRILIAEDVDLNAEILGDLLEMEDMEYERAENGKKALEMFSASEPGYFDAVLMDVRMPVMDGLSATEAIRALDRPDARTVPIIALTANAFDDDVQMSIKAGMNEHLSKPVDPDLLYETLGRLIAEKG